MAKELKSGTIRKWDLDEKGEPLAKLPTKEKPRVIQAIFRGLRTIPSAFGPDKTGYIMDLDLGQEQQTWSVPTILFSKLQGVAPGTPLRFEYGGKEMKKSGNEAHEFKVFELNPEEARDLDIPFA